MEQISGMCLVRAELTWGNVGKSVLGFVLVGSCGWYTFIIGKGLCVSERKGQRRKP